MIDLATWDVALPVPKGSETEQTRYVCRTCRVPRPHTDFGIAKGKRATECFPCARRRWTLNRRTRLRKRKCNKCRTRLPFDCFPTVDGRLSNICNDCTIERAARNEAKRMRAEERRALLAAKREKRYQVLRERFEQRQRERQAGKPEPTPPVPTPMDPAQLRLNLMRVPDFSRVAQFMLYGIKPYHKLDHTERCKVYSVTRELARRYSPDWLPIFDQRESPVDSVLRDWAEVFVDATPLPVEVQAYVTALQIPRQELAHAS
jgi:hypothetical protein